MSDEELTIFRRRNIGFIFQNYNLVPILNVYENIVMPIQLDGKKPDGRFIQEVVELLGLEKKLDNMPNTLSGGQQQRVSIARALGSAETTAEGAELLRQIGHTQAASFRLFPSIDRSVRQFGAAAAGTVGILAILLLGMSIRFLWKRETLYRQAEGIITRFSEGDFRSHLPQTENGSIYQLFSAVEELAVALRAQSEKEQRMKAFLRNTISDISHQLKTPIASIRMYHNLLERKELEELKRGSAR